MPHLAFQLWMSISDLCQSEVDSQRTQTWCLTATKRLFIYFKQNSHIHNLPSGKFAYSSGNGALYHVWISYSPNRIERIRGTLSTDVMGVSIGVEGVGDVVEPGVGGGICKSVERRVEGPAIGVSGISEVLRCGGSGGGCGLNLCFSCMISPSQVSI